MSAVTLRVQQQGYVRSTGFQATQWAVTVPVAVPTGSTPVATDPLGYAPLFVVDTSGETEVLRRVATLRDYAALTQFELQYFDVRSPNAQLWFESVQVGDTLRIPNGPPHWLQAQAPYTNHDFVIQGVYTRASGASPQVATGRLLTLPGYGFTPDDVGRWVRLTGFTTTAYNGLTQIVSYLGNVATVTKTFSGPETGGTWQFEYVSVRSNPLGPGYEPRYFPTRAKDLPWALYRASTLLASGTGGGVTMRERKDPLVRSVRFTHLAATLDDGANLFEYVAAELDRLQAEAARNDTAFTTLLTRTEGP
jgi:hypothetical protein